MRASLKMPVNMVIDNIARLLCLWGCTSCQVELNSEDEKKISKS